MDEERSDRFWSKVEATGFCWNWTAGRQGDGYGIFRVGKSSGLAHRISFSELTGVDISGKILDHLCRNRACVNPDHLEVVSNAENVRRGYGHPGVNSRKTHCKRGHEFSAENTRIQIRRGVENRSCKTCVRESQRA